MSGKNEQMKEDLTLNWRRKGTMISITSYKCFTPKYIPVQIHQASSHPALTLNNFHDCRLTFNVIQGQRGSPKSSNHHWLSVWANYFWTITNSSSFNWYFVLLNVKTWSDSSKRLPKKNSRLFYLSQGYNWLVEIKHVSSLEAIKELRVHSNFILLRIS